jgi:hypothetical protein
VLGEFVGRHAVAVGEDEGPESGPEGNHIFGAGPFGVVDELF